MYRRQVRRRRAILVTLVVASLVLISTYIAEGDEGPLHTITDGVAVALGPVESGVSSALKPVRDLIGWFDETFEARGENEALREEVDELREELARSEGALEENRELRALTRLGEGDGLEAYTPVAARVVGRSSSTWFQTVIINKGNGDGVEVDDPVLTSAGLIGRVHRVRPTSSVVALLTHPEAAQVKARVQGEGPPGLVVPEVGRRRGLLFEVIASEREVEVGARIVTAGSTEGELSSLYPPGIPVGQVSAARPQRGDVAGRITIEPYADLEDLTIVSVLTGGPGAPEVAQP